jgi:hypothetical protein
MQKNPYYNVETFKNAKIKAYDGARLHEVNEHFGQVA